MPKDAPTTDSLSHLPTASLLIDPFSLLQLPERLERDYREVHLAHHRNRVRLWYPILIATGLVYGIERIGSGSLGQSASSPELIIWFALLLPAWILLAAVTWSGRYERLYGRGSPLLIAISSCALAWMTALLIAQGHGEALSALATYLLGVMFLAGLQFRDVTRVCGLTLLTFAVTCTVIGGSLFELVLNSVSPFITVAIGAYVLYELEKNARRAFLDRRIALEQAAHDGITGLKNRRAFDEHLKRIWHHAARETRPLGLLLIDADYFKRYNDRYGHQAGDRALRRLADTIQCFAGRPLDLAARFGGEELAVILYDMDCLQVRKMAEGIRVAIQNLSIPHLDSDTADVVTVSIGAACINPVGSRSHEGLVYVADQALYDAKRKGRNRVFLVDDEFLAQATGIFHTPLLQTDPGRALG